MTAAVPRWFVADDYSPPVRSWWVSYWITAERTGRSMGGGVAQIFGPTYEAASKRAIEQLRARFDSPRAAITLTDPKEHIEEITS